MAEATRELFEAVREACSRGVWSRGVELARAAAVAPEPGAHDEFVLRVHSGAGVVTPTVVLSPADLDWECDCGGREDPCEHVAAACIALQRAGGSPAALAPAEASGARLRYAFLRAPDGLRFERRVCVDGEEHPFTGTLSARAAGRIEGPRVAASPADHDAELALGSSRVGRLPRGVLHKLLRILERCPDVTFDGEPVATSGAAVGWCVHVSDAGEGFRVVAKRDPEPDALLGDDVALCAGVLRPLGSSGLTGAELQQLVPGRHYPPDAAAELVTEQLPELERRVPVVVETRRLPRADRARPRVRVVATREEDALVLLPQLVYGEPASARVDAGKLVPLGEGPLPMRDPAAEQRAVSALREALGLTPGHRVSFRGEEALAMRARLERFPGEVAGRAADHFYRAETLEAAVETGADGRLELRFSTPGPDPNAPAGRADPEAVLGAWRRGESLVPLLDGGLAPLPTDWLARHGERLADLLGARDAQGRVAAAALPALAELCDELGVPAPEAARRLLRELERSTELELPADLRAELRPYQREGVAWLSRLGAAGLGALLADDMGLGKTLQTLCALRGRTLIVAPTSVLPTWEAEIARFRPGLRVCTHHGSDRSLEPEADIVLTSYALLRIDRALLTGERFETLVLDEAQAIKNPESQVAQAAFALDGRFRIALTGTPVENRLEELWSLFRFLAPGLLGTREDFQQRLARPIAAGDAMAVERLRARIRPYLLRRRKQEVARELPPLQEQVLRVALSEEEQAGYDAVRAAMVPDVVARLREGGNVLDALQALLRLRQACCHPALLPGGSGERSAKLEALLEHLDTLVADGHRALVFSQWTSLLDLVEPPLHDAGIAFERLDGSTRDRGGVIGRFSADDGPPVLLLSLKAGGTGLNLTRADHVFLLDPWWNPAVEDQAAARAHRIGQQRPVLVHRMVAAGSVEERILELQERKRALADAALGGEAVATPPTREELLALLS